MQIKMKIRKIKQLLKKMIGIGLTVTEMQEMVQDKPMVRLMHEQWDNAPQFHLMDKVDSNELWQSIWKKNFPSEYRQRKVFRLGLFIAAAAVALLMLGTWMNDTVMNPYITIICKDQDKMMVSLPDSSKVWMNSGSRLMYKQKFMKDRKVELYGEAFFSVKKIDNSPFKVHLEGACVKVKGTEFNVRSDNRKIEVTLFTGIVAFSFPKGKEVLMAPNDQIIYDTSTKSLRKNHVDTAEYDWRSNEYSFSHKSLQELILFLNRMHDVSIKIADKKQEDMLFTGIIRRSESLSDILDKICISFNLKYKEVKDEIILYE